MLLACIPYGYIVCVDAKCGVHSTFAAGMEGNTCSSGCVARLCIVEFRPGLMSILVSIN